MPPWHGAGPSYERVSKCGGPRGRINPALFRALIPRTTLQGLKHKSQHKNPQQYSRVEKTSSSHWLRSEMDDKHFLPRLLHLSRIIDKTRIIRKLGPQTLKVTCLYTTLFTLHVICLNIVKIKVHIRRRGNCIRAVTGDTLGRSCFISVSIVLTLLHCGADLGRHQHMLLQELLWITEVSRIFRSGKPRSPTAPNCVAEMKMWRNVTSNSWSQFCNFCNVALGLESGSSQFHHFINIET